MRSTKTRRGLLALALAMLSLAGSLAYVLAHDAVGADPMQLADADVGQAASAKGSFAPYFVIPAAVDARWAPVHDVLSNATYVLLGTDPSLVVLVTAEQAHGDSAGAIVRGPVALRMPHPDGSGRTLLVLRATEWTHPLVFG
ncbi:MAG: hypothetical protein LC620_04215 [Halobacteriales archaeon]|nr:hypothetical protein [Halobacteriales archaeon]